MDSPAFPLSPAAIAVPVLAFVTMIINIAPFIWHIKNRNIPAASLMFWILLQLFFDFINALIWPKDDTANWFQGFVLCDIEVKLLLGATVGLPGALASIMRNLAMALNTDKPILMNSVTQNRRKLFVECFLSFGFPAYIMVIHYVVQPSRYYIYAIAGCVISFDDSWPTVILVWIWPSILSILGVYYSVLVLVRMRKYRQEFAAILGSNDSRMTKSRFQRLFLVSGTLIVIVLPVQFYVLAKTTSYPFIRYDWATVHGESWQDIIMVPTGGVVFYDRWVHIAVGFVVFFFFGLGVEAKKLYQGWLLACGFDRILPQCANPFFKVSSNGSSVKRLNIDTTMNDSVSTYMQSPSSSDPQKEICPLSPIRTRNTGLEALPYDSVELEEQVTRQKSRKVKKIPYIASFISAFRSPNASRQMAARERNDSG